MTTLAMIFSVAEDCPSRATTCPEGEVVCEPIGSFLPPDPDE